MIKAYNAKQWEIPLLQDGRKTVTRRVIKVPPYYPHFYKLRDNTDGAITSIMNRLYAGFYNDEQIFFIDGEKHVDAVYYEAPYQPGDILYVRETWGCYERNWWEAGYFLHKADYPDGVNTYEFDGHICDLPKWRPSIYMPQEAARIWLKVKDVRVERLQDITEQQAINEGISRLYDELSDAEYEDWTKRTGIYPKAKADWGYKNYLWHGNFGTCGTGNWKSDNWDYQYSSYDNAVGSFSSLWNSTLKKSDLDRYGWYANPWVWVMEFERCEKPENI